jgi:hypothetical protein
LAANGQAYCWGRQRRGELGIGSWGVELEPVLVKGGIDFRPPAGMAIPVLGEGRRH